MQININIDEKKVKAYQDANVEKLKNHQVIRNWLKQYQLDDTFISEHCYELAQFSETCDKCLNCSGLTSCKFKDCGHPEMLTYDNKQLNFVKSNCRYMREKASKVEHRQNFVVCDMSYEQLTYHPKMSLDRSADMGINGYNDYMNIFKTFSSKDIKQDYKGEVFYGIPGVGKTFAACCLVNRLAKQGYQVAFVNVPLLINRLKETFNDYHSDYNFELNKLKKVDFLVLDDFGSEKISAWERDEVLLPLLSARMEHKRCTYFTTNYDQEGLVNRYMLSKNDKIEAIRLIERVVALADFHPVVGVSQR